ncbi:MAG: hypothetical protein RLY87_2346 [Chloroflexota bacterium]|jgi:simple sugar transport system permease protein
MNLLRAVRAPVVAILAALVLTSVVLGTTDASAIDAFTVLFSGSLTTSSRLADMIMLAAPLLLCAAGLSISFAAGQYNLGIEGQMTIGGVVSMAILKMYPEGGLAPLYWIGALLLGALAGAAWAGVVALLKQYTRVSEIFVGLGLNFVAVGVSLYMVFGPWKRPGVASMSGTEPLPDALWLPVVGTTRLTLVTPLIAIAVLGLVWWLLRATQWGLEVRASGISQPASRRLGVPAIRRTFQAMLVCGAAAGLAGALQVLGVYHALVPNLASGIGFMGLLVALLINADVRFVAPLVLLFAVLTAGSIQLPLSFSIDSSISGVFQGFLVLAMIVARAAISGKERA